MKNTSRIRIQSIILIKIMYWIQHKKGKEADKNGVKDGKSLCKLVNNAIYVKAMENLRNRIDVRLVNNKNTI